jgi:hypothetical protein
MPGVSGSGFGESIVFNSRITGYNCTSPEDCQVAVCRWRTWIQCVCWNFRLGTANAKVCRNLQVQYTAYVVGSSTVSGWRYRHLFNSKRNRGSPRKRRYFCLRNWRITGILPTVLGPELRLTSMTSMRLSQPSTRVNEYQVSIPVSQTILERLTLIEILSQRRRPQAAV